MIVLIVELMNVNESRI